MLDLPNMTCPSLEIEYAQRTDHADGNRHLTLAAQSGGFYPGTQAIASFACQL